MKVGLRWRPCSPLRQPSTHKPTLSLPLLLQEAAAGEGPDLMAFYRPRELFTETPFLEVGGLPPLKLQAQRRHPATTFLMYRKLQQWAS